MTNTLENAAAVHQRSEAEQVEMLLLHYRINQLNADYAACLDEKRFDDWPGFFREDGLYKVQSRENFEMGLPLALIDLESRAMMKDRVYGATQTIYHAPYYTRHVLGASRVVRLVDEEVETETAYAIFRTKPGASGGGVSEVYSVGRYIDLIDRCGTDLMFAQRLCVYDSEMILNSLIYPI
jgi:salicylate 5-hydroxylase small subunit